MPKSRVFSAGVLNVRNEIQKAPVYEALFRAAYKLKHPVKVRGNEFIILTSIQPSKDNIIDGTFARFTEIDTDLPWFNLDSLREAKEDEVDQIAIPENLRPNMATFFYSFDTKGHKFYFEARSHTGKISPHQVAKFLNELLNRAKLLDEFSTTSVTLVSSFEQFEKAIALFRLSRLIIRIDRPNPDDLGEIEERVKRRLSRQNARTMVDELIADRGKSLKPDKETKQLGEVAALNGEVKAFGKNEDGTPVERSTAEHPLIESVRYNPDHTTDRQAFNRTIEAIRQEIRSRNVRR